MCLGIPGQIVEIVDDVNHIAKAEVSGVKQERQHRPARPKGTTQSASATGC